MNKFIALTVLLLSSVLVAAGPLTIDVGGGALFRLQDEVLDAFNRKVRFEMTLNSNLHLLETATAICFDSDDTFSISDGAPGWGMSFLCTVSECSTNAHLHTLLFGSHYQEGHWVGGGVDASFTWNGGLEPNDGIFPVAQFYMGISLAASINLPDLEAAVDTYYKCFTNFDGSYVEDNLLVDINLDSDWQEHNVTVAATPSLP
ncbi:unnamed protein product [Moneuplotes crassus]|uniref:Uncharacterized protein n=1 Tax=Euplotes crassus TaxID=5936 RepID=A0AAD2D1Q2_EUPCR|nr:unnamed protein product [Moneuplotes crassus]